MFITRDGIKLLPMLSALTATKRKIYMKKIVAGKGRGEGELCACIDSEYPNLTMKHPSFQ